MRILLVALALLAPTTALAGPIGSQVGDGGSSLPPCNSAWWGSTAQYQGRTWKCYPGANHWTIV